MKTNVQFFQAQHTQVKRNYFGRVPDEEKAHCAEVAKKFGFEYWDGERKYGYGGYRYDGRWAPFAEKLIKHYGLRPDAKILDIGCGKGFLLHELKKLLPQATIRGIDVSNYALENAKEEAKPYLKWGHAKKLEFPDNEFDLVLALNSLHNLYIFDLFSAMKEIQRVCRGDSYLVVESYRNEAEKVHLLYWQLTCEAFFAPEEWKWIFDQCGYTGDYEFIFFE